MSAPRCIPLDVISDARVGGKAEGLVRLVKEGFDVPPAFVIVDASSDSFPDDLDAFYQRIGGGKVAVRSSAVGEDSKDASFAGQFHHRLLGLQGWLNSFGFRLSLKSHRPGRAGAGRESPPC